MKITQFVAVQIFTSNVTLWKLNSCLIYRDNAQNESLQGVKTKKNVKGLFRTADNGKFVLAVCDFKEEAAQVTLTCSAPL